MGLQDLLKEKTKQQSALEKLLQNKLSTDDQEYTENPRMAIVNANLSDAEKSMGDSERQYQEQYTNLEPQDTPIANVNPEFAENHPSINKALEIATYPIRKVMEKPWMERSGQTGAEYVTSVENPDKVTTGSKFGDTTADLMGAVMGFAENPQSVASKLWKGAENVVEKGMSKIPQLSKLPEVLQTGLKLGATTVPFEATMSTLNDRDMSAGEMAKSAGANALLGVLPYGLGRIGKSLKGETKVEIETPKLELKTPEIIPTEIIPTTPKTYRLPNTAQEAMNDLTTGIEAAQNFVMHNDILAAYPPGTTVEAALADIKKNTGVDLIELMAKLEKAEATPGLKQQVTNQAQYSRLGQAAGVIPVPEKLVGLGRERILGQKQFPLNPNKILAEDIGLNNSNKILNEDIGLENPTFSTTVPLSGANKSKLNAEPVIPVGQKERGFSANTRTDINNPDALRDSYTENPLTYEQLGNPETLAKAQTIFDEGFESARTQLSELASKMKPEAIPLAKLLSRQATESGNIQGAREIISEVAEKLTQAGQFGQAARILREADPETFLLTITKQLKKLNKQGSETYGKKWKDIDLTNDELDMIGKIKRGDQQSYEDAFEKIGDRIANDLPATAMEKVNAWRHIAMLLNPKTQVRNVVGNAFMTVMRRTAKQTSALLQNVFLKPEERTQVFQIKPEYQNAAKTYFEANKKDLLGGANKYNENIKLNMPNKRVFQNETLEKTRKFTYKLLEIGDVPFYKDAYINRLASYAQAKGIKDFDKLPEEAFAIAKREAEEATYKDASKFANWLNGVKNPGPKANLFQKSTAIVAEAALPFTKTPANIINRGIEYSPAGVLKGFYTWGSQKQAAQGIDELAKGLTGTAVVGLGYLLASKGVLTGKASSDKDLKAYNSNTGNSPFSILGKYTYDWMQPFSVPLSMGVEIYNALKDNPTDAQKMENTIYNNDTSKLAQFAISMTDALVSSLSASSDTVFNMSIMRGIKNTIFNQQGLGEGLSQLPQQYASQFIPTLSGQIAGIVDPTVRQTYVKNNLPESAKAALLNKIPFASKTLQPKQTPFGENVKRIENPILRAISQLTSPGNYAVNQKIDPKIDTELRRLNKQGFKNQFPTMVENYISGTKEYPRINLTPEETILYQKAVGKATYESFNKIINHNAYIRATDEEKEQMLSKAISEAKAQVKKDIVKSKGYKIK